MSNTIKSKEWYVNQVLYHYIDFGFFDKSYITESQYNEIHRVFIPTGYKNILYGLTRKNAIKRIENRLYFNNSSKKFKLDGYKKNKRIRYKNKNELRKDLNEFYYGD